MFSARRLFESILTGFSSTTRIIGKWCMLVSSRFSTSEMFKSTPWSSPCQANSQCWRRSHKYIYVWLWLSRSTVEVECNIAVTARSLASRMLKLTSRSSLCTTKEKEGQLKVKLTTTFKVSNHDKVTYYGLFSLIEILDFKKVRIDKYV